MANEEDISFKDTGNSYRPLSTRSLTFKLVSVGPTSACYASQRHFSLDFSVYEKVKERESITTSVLSSKRQVGKMVENGEEDK